jgi:hypothetical protein
VRIYASNLVQPSGLIEPDQLSGIGMGQGTWHPRRLTALLATAHTAATAAFQSERNSDNQRTTPGADRLRHSHQFVARLLEGEKMAPPSETLNDMLIVMLLTAQRRGEVCTMRWQDVDLVTAGG